MEQYFAFYHLADPAGQVLYVLFVTPEDADAEVLSDPTLGYVEAPGAITPADYYVADGLLFLKPETPPTAPPAAAPVHDYAFYDTTDPDGPVLFVGTMTEDDAINSITDIDIAYLETPGPIDPAEWYVSAGVLVAKIALPITADKLTVTADGADTVTFSNIPADTLVTLAATVDFPAASETVTGTTTLTTLHRLPHVVRFEKLHRLPKEFTINGV
jgi:hypothetical protein